MTHDSEQSHSHNAGLSPRTIRKRRRNRNLAHWMLALAFLTAIPGWTLYYFSIRIAQRSPSAESPTPLVIAAYLLLIISSSTLVLGLWYLLLAQVRRIAHITGEEEVLDETGTPVAHPLCSNCGWFFDPPDRFCRHCGKPLASPHAEAAAPVPEKS